MDENTRLMLILEAFEESKITETKDLLKLAKELLKSIEKLAE